MSNKRRFARTGAATLALGALLALGGGAPALAQETGEVRGRVLDTDGRPVANARVALEPIGLEAVTGPEGQFVLRRVPAGALRVRVERLGFETATRWVEVPAGERVIVELTLDPRPVRVREVTVIGSRAESAEIEERLREIPGAVAFVAPQEIERTRQANMKDVLRFTPGVYIQPRFGAADESQLSIRGSGLRNNFHLRGVNILVNGMPYRNADGFTDFESLELLTVQSIQVYKGGNALRLGGSTLGGAIDLRTHTGDSAEPVTLFLQGGSYGFLKAHGASGAVLDDVNYYASYTRTELDGYREFAGQGRDRLNAHLGWRASRDLDLRAFYFFADVREELPGALTATEFGEQPRAAAPSSREDRWGRDYTLHHLGAQLRAQIGDHQRLEISPYLQVRDIVHPIFRVLDQESRDFGLELRYENRDSFLGRRNRLTLGVQPATGSVDNRHFENEGGEAGALAKDQRDEASTIALYAEDMFGMTDHLSVVLGLRYDRSRRSVEDFFLEDGDQTDERRFEAVMPKVGLLWELAEVSGQVFANASRMSEPPLLLELNSLAVPGFIELEAQDAWQMEVGTRGSAGVMDWTLSGYDIELRNEIINENVQPFPDAPFTVPTYHNVERSRHYGLEIGLGFEVSGPGSTGRDSDDLLAGRLSYTFGRFTFVEDSEFEGNRIPGAPSHVLQAELAYRHPSGLRLSPNVEWVPGDYFVDSANTVRNEGWTVLGARLEWALESLGAMAFLEGRNLTDRLYSPAVNVDDASGRFFQPADGRSVYGGFQWELPR